MKLAPVDLSYLQEHFTELATRLGEVWESSGPTGEELDTPFLLRDAMSQLIDVLAQLQSEAPQTIENPTEINTLGEYGLHLIGELSKLAMHLDQPALAREVEHLSLPFALWIARHGGEIRHLEPIVNALAHFANQAGHPQAMVSLYTQCCELIEATSPAACEDPEQNNPHHPWRLLLLNRAIVATRSHNPELMEPAFDAIVEHLPNDVQRFFAEGMEQIAIINYPEPVREVVRRYFLEHGGPRRLH